MTPLPIPDDPAPSRAADELLVVRCQLGEADALDALIARWHQPLWRYVRRVAGNDEDARDVVQDVWLRVFRGIARLRDGARWRGWLFGIARRVLIDRLRVRYAAPTEVDITAADFAADPGPAGDDADLTALEAALDTLPVDQRELLTLFYLRELSLAELADTLGIPAGTVKSRLFRARHMLRDALQGASAS